MWPEGWEGWKKLKVKHCFRISAAIFQNYSPIACRICQLRKTGHASRSIGLYLIDNRSSHAVNEMMQSLRLKIGYSGFYGIEMNVFRSKSHWMCFDLSHIQWVQDTDRRSDYRPRSCHAALVSHSFAFKRESINSDLLDMHVYSFGWMRGWMLLYLVLWFSSLFYCR